MGLLVASPLPALFGGDTRSRPLADWRRCKSAKMASTSKLNGADRSSRIRRTCKTIGSSHIISVSHQGLGRTDHRHTQPRLITHHGHSSRDLGVGQVAAIPREEVIDVVDRCYGDMSCIADGVRRNRSACQDCPGQRLGLSRNLKKWKISKHAHPLSNLLWITGRRFIDDNLGNETPELSSAITPPILGCLLVCSNKEIATRTSHQVTDERRFQVDGFQGLLQWQDASFLKAGGQSFHAISGGQPASRSAVITRQRDVSVDRVARTRWAIARNRPAALSISAYLEPRGAAPNSRSMYSTS